MVIKSFFKVIFIVSALFFSEVICAYNSETITFSHISINDGLSQNTVFSITQDKSDNMWFATYDGVNRYDGYEFTVYRHDENDSVSIAGNITRCVVTDSKGRILVGTNKGVSLYNKETDTFKNFLITDRNNALVTDIVEISDNLYIINSDGVLYVLDLSMNSFRDDILIPDLVSKKVSSIYRVNDTIYIGCVNGHLHSYSFVSNKFIPSSSFEVGAKVQTMLLYNLHELWIGTEGNGLIKLDLRTGDLKNYRHTSDKNSISSDYIRSLARDANGRLWIGTFNDLNIYSNTSDDFVIYTNDETNSGSLSQRSVRCIYKDNQGGMWLGTYFGGLNYYHPLKYRFHNIMHEPYRNSLSDNVVSCIVEDENFMLWIGTNDGGLNCYNPADESFRYYKLNYEDKDISSESNNVKSLYIDKKSDNVYVGTHAGGLKVVNRRTGFIRHLYIRDSDIMANSIYSILPRDEERLWLGTLNGLYLYNMRSDEFIHVDETGFSKKEIYAMFIDSSGCLIIAFDDCLVKYKIEGNHLERVSFGINGMSDIKTVQQIYQTEDGRIWLATRVGLYYTDEKNREIVHLTETDGLPNNVIYGIEEDSFNNIWVSTNKGLSCFNPYSRTFRNFSIKDGIQSNQFNNYSHCRTSDGRLYFGGINGITTFRPELLIDNPYAPQPVITKFKLFGKEVRPGDETGILRKHISDTDSIILNSSQKSFTLQFVVSNYLSGQHNAFSYKLEGYDDTWNYTEDNLSVSYHNLPHGEYHFKVRAANNDGKWNKKSKELYIKVLPEWYETWWAILIMIFLVISAITLVFRYFWVKKQMENRLIMEHNEKLHQEEINQMKQRFFINISHELRTPLTLIISPVQEMKIRTTDKWMKEQLGFVERNTNRLLHLVNQLMDYRRAELGVFKLRVSKREIYSVVKDCFSFYEKLARYKSLNYNFISDLEGIDVLADEKYVEIIINNLLSNAFKYTKEGSITVNLSLNDNFLILNVTDTGIGIPFNKHKKIFERFTQLDSTYMGSGIGLSLVQRLVELHHGKIELKSEPGKGSSFSIFIPQDKSVYAEIELAENIYEPEQQLHFTNTKDEYFVDSEMDEFVINDESDTSARGNILIVEDNEEVRQYLKSGLSKVFNTLQAENGEVALEVLKNNEIDIVITDLMMPVMDGVKLCKAIKQNVSTSHIPVIILSARTELSDQKEVMALGADDYIAKPFSLSLLITKIQNIVRTRRRMLEHYSKELDVEPEKITFNALDEEILKRAVEIVKNNMDNSSFSTEDFASQMNMSRSNLHLKLKAITGESAIEFIKKIRFSEACRLLKEGRYNIAEISTMVGFSTPSYFATSFKKYIGCLPTEYIKQQK